MPENNNWSKFISILGGGLLTAYSVFTIFFTTDIVKAIIAVLGIFLVGCQLKKNTNIKQKNIYIITIIILIITIGFIVFGFIFKLMPTTITGKLINNKNNPISNIKIKINDSSGVVHITSTDQNGIFIIKNIPQGQYTITIEDDLLYNGEVFNSLIKMGKMETNLGNIVYKQIPIYYEAKSGLYGNGAIIHEQFKCIGGMNNINAWTMVEKINGYELGGFFILKIRYASAEPDVDIIKKSLYINDEFIMQISFPITGGWGIFKEEQIQKKILLKPGRINKIKLQNNENNKDYGGMNIESYIIIH